MRPWVLLLLAGLPCIACSRSGPSGGEHSAPSASVVTLGVALGTCPDVAACERECDAGSADRCRRLAASYAMGQGVSKDETKATGLYEHACAMKDPPACLFAGQMHEFEHGVPRDYAKAAEFYGRACDLGWTPGCYNLAIMYERGTGVPADRTKAADLYQVACTAGAQQACDRARQLHAPPVPPFLEGGLP